MQDADPPPEDERVSLVLSIYPTLLERGLKEMADFQGLVMMDANPSGPVAIGGPFDPAILVAAASG